MLLKGSLFCVGWVCTSETNGWMDGLIFCRGCCCARVAVETLAILLLLEAFLWLGWLVFMCDCLHDVPMCWHWVGSAVGWMVGLVLWLGWCWARVAAEQIVRGVALGFVAVARVACVHVWFCV